VTYFDRQPIDKKEALGKQTTIENVSYSVMRKNQRLIMIEIIPCLLSIKPPPWVNSDAKFVAKTAAALPVATLNYRCIFKISPIFQIFIIYYGSVYRQLSSW